MAGRRIVFTGPSGIGIEPALRRFISRLPAGRSKVREEPLILKIEDKMLELYSPGFPKEESAQVLFKLLNEPIVKLKSLWRESFENILVEIESDENKSRDIFLNFHAVSYVHKTVEYIPLANLDLVRKYHPEIFITFIDDIYDVHDRLRGPSQIFSREFGGSTEPIGAIIELLRILDWRSKEIMMTRYIAEELNVLDHYVVASKHSFDTVYDILYKGEKNKVYLSHPISEVKNLFSDNRTQQAREIIKEIDELQMAVSDAFCGFFPTTIDELRIRKDDRGGSFLNELIPRWDSEKYVTTTNTFFAPAPRSGEDFLWKEPGNSTTGYSVLLNSLWNHILFHVSARDHKLVEQSNILIVYRPCFNGRPSDGVGNEIEYYQRMKKLSQPTRKCFIYLPRKDKISLRIKQMQGLLRSKLQVTSSTENVRNFELSASECDKLVSVEDNVSKIQGVIQKIIHDHPTTLTVEQSAVGEDRSQVALKICEKIASDYVAGLNDQLKKYTDVADRLWDEDDLTPKEFISKISEELKN